jgi:hypothetical protein
VEGRVLQPVRRRRRRGSRRGLRLSLVLFVVLIAAGVVVVVRGRHKSHAAAARAPVPALETAALPASARAGARPPRLVFGPAVVRKRRL